MPQQPSHPLVAEWLADSSFVAANKANATSVLNHFDAWCRAHDTTITGARRRDVRAYLDERATTPTERTGRLPAQSTQRGDWRHLRSFYRWAATPVIEGGGGELDADPMVGVKGPKVSDRPTTKRADPLDVRALERIFDNGKLGRRNAAMVSLMFRSGLRVGELGWLDLADLQGRPDGRAVLAVPITKSDEPRLVPIHPETKRYLDRYLRARGPLPGPLFLGATNRTNDVNGRLQTRAIKDMVERAARRAGVRISPHQLRRTWTSEYLRAGGDTLSMEIIGGWNDPRMPRRYLADEAAAASLDRGFEVMDRQSASGAQRHRLRSLG